MVDHNQMIALLRTAVTAGAAESLDHPADGYVMDAADAVWANFGLRYEAEACSLLDAQPSDNRVQALVSLLRQAVISGATDALESARTLPLVQVSTAIWSKVGASYEDRLRALGVSDEAAGVQ